MLIRVPGIRQCRSSIFYRKTALWLIILGKVRCCVFRFSPADSRRRKKGGSRVNKKKMFIAQHARTFFSLKNVTLMLTRRTSSQIQSDLVRLFVPACTMQLPESRNIHTTSVPNTFSVENIKPVGAVQKILKKLHILDIEKYKTLAFGTKVYESVLKQIDYPFFFKYFNMADTFYSWFLITELHVWMMMVRYMAEGKIGRVIRTQLVYTLWMDMRARVENLGHIKLKIKRNQVKELGEQFQAAIIGYDEGIQSNDRVLAAALWRRFFNSECNNPEQIEILLIYVRKQICLFDNLPSHEILKEPVLKLMDIKSLCKNH